MNAQGKWSAAEVTIRHTSWGGTLYDLSDYALPVGESIVVVTLIGDRGVSIEPERFHLNIRADGTAEVRHIPRPYSA